MPLTSGVAFFAAIIPLTFFNLIYLPNAIVNSFIALILILFIEWIKERNTP